jgi:Tfp pilus assembly protein PilO
VFDFFETIPRYQRILIISLVVIIIFTCYYYFLIKPQLQELTDLTQKIDSLNTQIQSIRAVETQLSEVQSLNVELKRKILGLSRILPDTAEMDNFLREIVAKASEAGLTILSFVPMGEREPVLDNTEENVDKKAGDKTGIKSANKTGTEPVKEEEEAPFVELPIKMKVLGTYDQVSEFCERCSKISRIVNINDLKMKSNTEKGQPSNLIETDYTATTFRSTEPIEATEGEKKTEPVEEKTPQELPAYPDGTYKDPFLSLIQPAKETSDNVKECEGYECLNVTDLTLQGIIKLKSGFGAMIHGNDGIGYLVIEGDKLFDGRVKSVSKDFAVFSKEVKDVVRDRVFEIERVLYISSE